ncbi:MAG TPA: outer membrane beta-barrel protein [Gemmatimonadota bacterium]|nr:outer membrane beta-barrel protein [Gemmatimonadota bacterium]
MNRNHARIAAVLALLAGFVPSGTARGQEPTLIQGKVLDGATGEPLIGAQVVIRGTDRGTVTDVDGRYSLRVDPGTYDLDVQYLGYAPKTVTGVVVAAGRSTFQDIAMVPEAVEAEGIRVVITAEEERGSVIGALAHQRRSTNVVSGVSAEEIARSPDSNAADAVKRVTGTSIVGDKYVYVRGLGERYSTAQLDGVSLPTPEPEKRVLPLDIFPSSMVESLFTVKSYTPDLPGDFAGGLVDIRTKDIPEEEFFSFSTGVGYASNLSDMNRPTYDGGSTDWLGFDDGARELPDAFPSDIPFDTPRGEVADLHSRFQGDFQAYTDQVDAGDVDKSFSVSLGSPVDWFGRRGGYLLGLTYSNEADTREQREFFPTLEEGTALYDYTTLVGSREISIGAIGGYAVNWTPTSRLSVKSVFTQSGDDETRLVSGPFNQSTTGIGRIQRFQFVERTLLNTRATFQHKTGFLGDGRVEWDAAYAFALRDEPDTRSTSYVAQEEGGTYFFNEAGSNNRFFSELTDHMVQGAVKSTTQFDWLEGRATLALGGGGSLRTRDFAARRFDYENASPDGRTLPPTQLFTSDRIAAGDIHFLETTATTDEYQAEEWAGAAYASLGLGLAPSLRATVGIRVEANETVVETFDPHAGTKVEGVSAELSTVEPLPTVTLEYEFGEQQLRAAGSRTIVRPQFRELAPFRYDTYLESTLGNPFLVNGEIYNADVRWSWYPSIGEIVSVGGFYKRFNDPIEIVRLPTAGTNLGTPEPYNGPAANTYGLELELRHDLGRWLPFQGLAFASNATFAESTVQQDEPIEVFFGNPSATEPDILPAELFTNPERPMVNQSPYLFNGSLQYTTPSGIAGIAILYNLVGERLTQVGVQGFDDIYEETRHTLDLTLDHRLMNSIDLKVAAENLTDSDIEFRLGDETTLLYSPGRSYSVKASYAF